MLYCSFCGKHQSEVAKLIAGPDVFICDACVDLMYDMVHGKLPAAATGSLRIAPAERGRAKLIKPEAEQ